VLVTGINLGIGVSRNWWCLAGREMGNDRIVEWFGLGVVWAGRNGKGGLAGEMVEKGGGLLKPGRAEVGWKRAMSEGRGRD